MTNSNETDDWLAHLSGRANRSASTESEREAETLREAILELDRRAGHEQSSDYATQAGVDRLQIRLKHEGLLKKKTRSEPLISTGWGIAASVIALTILANLFVDKDTPSYRGQNDAQGRPVVVSKQPGKLAAAMRDSLQQSGVDSVIYQTGDHWFLQVDAPRPPPADTVKALEAYGLSLPESGPLVIRLAPENDNAPP